LLVAAPVKRFVSVIWGALRERMEIKKHAIVVI
jgi:hypothetical protein